MSKTTQTEEANLRYNEQQNDEMVEALIYNAMPELLKLEKLMVRISDMTRNSELEDACAKFYDDIMPVFREYMK